MALKATFGEYGNPLSKIRGNLLVLDTRGIANKAVVNTVNGIEACGLEQYNTLVKEWLVVRIKPLDDTVGVTCLYLTVDRLPTSVISVTTTENCLSFAN